MIAALVKGLYMQDLRILRAIMEAIDALLKLDFFYDWRQKDCSVARMFEVNDGLNALDEV